MSVLIGRDFESRLGFIFISLYIDIVVENIAMLLIVKQLAEKYLCFHDRGPHIRDRKNRNIVVLLSTPGDGL